MAYTDLNQLKADYFPKSTSPSEAAALSRILDSVSAFVDSYCQRPAGYFNPAAADATEKRFRGEGENFLRLPVHVLGSITEVTLYGTPINPSYYYESDKNGWLYREDLTTPIGGHFGPIVLFDECYTFKVTARWGYESTPADLQEAVRQIVAAVWERQHGVLGQVTPAGFTIERAMPLFAREVLDKYKRRPFEIGGRQS